MSVGKTRYVIHWIVIYPVDSVIHPLKNQNLALSDYKTYKLSNIRTWAPQEQKPGHRDLENYLWNNNLILPDKQKDATVSEWNHPKNILCIQFYLFIYLFLFIGVSSSSLVERNQETALSTQHHTSAG